MCRLTSGLGAAQERPDAHSGSDSNAVHGGRVDPGSASDRKRVCNDCSSDRAQANCPRPRFRPRQHCLPSERRTRPSLRQSRASCPQAAALATAPSEIPIALIWAIDSEVSIKWFVSSLAGLAVANGRRTCPRPEKRPGTIFVVLRKRIDQRLNVRHTDTRHRVIATASLIVRAR